ncbi:hypothetical protein [Equine adenovirus 1]|uniref:Uncharacterized protein ORF9 n=1 Tax=Equine adenovirus A serotype 1 TaxID=46916 RepID=G5CZ79_ADEE1|nr:hypothetical protein BGI55_gp09 [Equine adenovirus 1]AEP16430.1 unknown [Equine adenovirus 1]ANG08555.1 hypothetical protein [Equine adenovirus 1]
MHEPHGHLFAGEQRPHVVVKRRLKVHLLLHGLLIRGHQVRGTHVGLRGADAAAGALFEVGLREHPVGGEAFAESAPRLEAEMPPALALLSLVVSKSILARYEGLGGVPLYLHPGVPLGRGAALESHQPLALPLGPLSGGSRRHRGLHLPQHRMHLRRSTCIPTLCLSVPCRTRKTWPGSPARPFIPWSCFGPCETSSIAKGSSRAPAPPRPAWRGCPSTSTAITASC